MPFGIWFNTPDPEHHLFPKFGISHSYADITEPDTWEGKIQPNTRMIVVETPSNPALDILDSGVAGQSFGEEA